MINKIVDIVLTNKNLKVMLFFIFILLILFILVVIPFVLYTGELCFKDVVAPIIISFSALFASAVAMISLRSNNIQKQLEENKNDISNIRILSLKLRSSNKKLEIYKEITLSKRKTNYQLLNDFKQTFHKLENILNDKIFIYHISFSKNKENSFELLNSMESNLSLLMVKLNEILEWKEKANKNKFEYLPKNILNTTHIDGLISNCESLYDIILEIDNSINNSYKKLAKQENY